ncbi:MAG TPA: hypothetical protein DEQ50_06530 [Lactobacillus sp.]|nr:hypothetical protein [Lactobacillus sp.]
MADRSKDTEVVYKKDGSKIGESKVGEASVTITGLAGGTVVAEGDYQVTFKDSVTGLESEKVNVPGWTVLKTPEVPTGVASTPTHDGATVTAK